MVTIKNYTPHTIVLKTNGKTFKFPSEGVARVSVTSRFMGFLWNNDEDFAVDLTAVDYGDVEGLPDEDEEDGVYYIVSSMVLEAEPLRDDLLVPDGVVRGADGQVEYCTRFRIK